MIYRPFHKYYFNANLIYGFYYKLNGKDAYWKYYYNQNSKAILQSDPILTTLTVEISGYDIDNVTDSKSCVTSRYNNNSSSNALYDPQNNPLCFVSYCCPYSVLANNGSCLVANNGDCIVFNG
jgi:hypothetical protein